MKKRLKKYVFWDKNLIKVSATQKPQFWGGQETIFFEVFFGVCFIQATHKQTVGHGTQSKCNGVFWHPKKRNYRIHLTEYISKNRFFFQCKMCFETKGA